MVTEVPLKLIYVFYQFWNWVPYCVLVSSRLENEITQTRDLAEDEELESFTEEGRRDSSIRQQVLNSGEFMVVSFLS